MMFEMSTSQRRLLISVAIIVTVLVIGGWARNRLGIQLDVEAVRVFAEGLGTAGPILFVLIVAGRSLLALPSQVVLIAAGLCFGTVVGSVVGGAGLMLSGLAIFWIARYAGREFVESRTSLRGRHLLDFATRRSGASTFAVACAYPLIPLAPIQAAAGLTPMSTAYFTTAAFAGGSVRASIFAYFGNALVDSNWTGLLYATGLFLIIAAIPVTFPSGRKWLREFVAAQRNREEHEGQGEDGSTDFH
jgi:uncharacterized membrane protein YdjX (TVP38/TMEM64 family)